MFNLDAHFALHAQALQLSAKRAEVLARNIANAETPNYKAQDLDFRLALDTALRGSPSPSGQSANLLTTQASHLPGVPAAMGGPWRLQDRTDVLPSLDGNTVDIQREQAAFAQNAVRYQASLNFISSQMRGLMTAITGQ
ncbi:MAG: flagellar basal body rod protein FlgB [Steroidobacteraceae bacterium]|nr:flagellar basal body rod protein FlgB [Gammaproteobacteria bacterium]